MDDVCDSTYTSGWIAEFNSLYPSTVCHTTEPTLHLAKCQYDYAPGQNSTCPEAIQLQQCLPYEKFEIYGDNEPSLIYIEIAKYLEEEYECAGLCNVCPHFMYTDCNQGTVTEGCDDILLDLIKCNCVE